MIRLSSPGSVVASIPLMFGFHPENSLVVLGLSRTAGREHIRHGVRVDLDQIRGNERPAAADLAQRLRDQGADEALLIAFGPRGATGAKARPDHCRKLVAAVKAQLGAGPRDERVSVVDAIFTSGGRWWSYMCRNNRCCPAAGTMVPAEPPPALAALLAGQGQVFASRDAMDASFAPYAVTAVRRMKTALRRVPADASSTDQGVAEAHRLADELLLRCAEGRAEFSDAEGAALLSALAEWRVRDYLACSASDEPPAERLLCLMTELARRAPDAGWRTAPLSLAAWAAWALGRTSLAQCAVDRALAADAEYHFALLIRAGLHHGISSENVRASAENTRRELFGEGPSDGGAPGYGRSADDDEASVVLPPLPAQRAQFDGQEARS